MLANATALSHNQTVTPEAIRGASVANENNTQSGGIRTAAVIDKWPLAIIGIGLIASALWSAGLLYGGYRVALWIAGD
jgi:hypothetical protein